MVDGEIEFVLDKKYVHVEIYSDCGKYFNLILITSFSTTDEAKTFLIDFKFLFKTNLFISDLFLNQTFN